MESKSLEHLKSKIAKSNGFRDFDHLLEGELMRISMPCSQLKELLELYATQKAKEAWDRACEAQRVVCARKALTTYIWENDEWQIDEDSILTAPLAEYNEK